MVSLIIDIVLAVICLIIIIRNAVRGFIKSFMAFARTILAIFFAYVFNAPLAGVLDRNIFASLSAGWVKNAFLSTDDGQGAYKLYSLFDGIPEWFTNALIRSGVDEQTTDKYFYSEHSAPIEVVDELSQSLGGLLSGLISTVIAVIVIFVAVELILLLVGFLLNKVGQIPIFKFLNILLGATIGAIFSFVIVLLLATVVIWIIQFGASYNPTVFPETLITNSIFLKIFYEHNVWQIIAGFVIGK